MRKQSLDDGIKNQTDHLVGKDLLFSSEPPISPSSSSAGFVNILVPQNCGSSISTSTTSFYEYNEPVLSSTGKSMDISVITQINDEPVGVSDEELEQKPGTSNMVKNIYCFKIE